MEPIRVHGTRDEQLERYEREIAQSLAYQNNKENSLQCRQLAAMGEVDWMVARLYLTEEDR